MYRVVGDTYTVVINKSVFIMRARFLSDTTGSRKYTMTKSPQNDLYTLIISNVAHSDQGTYYCFFPPMGDKDSMRKRFHLFIEG